jgi:2,4-dienoyl-CoA reductase-like NADH-dependent reductase (Old Yellow Enzyme family)
VEQEFRFVFTPIKIGPITVRNRIFSQAHTTRFTGKDAMPDDRYVEYVRVRARGGFGMIICGMNMVMPNSLQFPTCQTCWQPEVVLVFRRMADACHEHGAVLLAQLAHCGKSGIL